MSRKKRIKRRRCLDCDVPLASGYTCALCMEHRRFIAQVHQDDIAADRCQQELTPDESAFRREEIFHARCALVPLRIGR